MLDAMTVAVVPLPASEDKLYFISFAIDSFL